MLGKRGEKTISAIPKNIGAIMLLKRKIFVGPIDAGTNENFKKMMEQNGYRVTTCSIFASKFNRNNDINFGIKPEDTKLTKIAKEAVFW